MARGGSRVLRVVLMVVKPVIVVTLQRRWWVRLRVMERLGAIRRGQTSKAHFTM